MGASVSGAEAPEDKKDCFHLSLGMERLHRHYPCPPLGRELGLYSGVWAWSVGRATEQNPSRFSRHACPELPLWDAPQAEGQASASTGHSQSQPRGETLLLLLHVLYAHTLRSGC